MDRIEEFEIAGKKVIYFDMANLKANIEFAEVIEKAKEIIIKYEKKSLFTIVNIKGVMFDSKTKEIVVQWMVFNEPYVSEGAVVGIDGIKRIMADAIFKTSGRKNIKVFQTKEEVIEYLENK